MALFSWTAKLFCTFCRQSIYPATLEPSNAARGFAQFIQIYNWRIPGFPCHFKKSTHVQAADILSDTCHANTLEASWQPFLSAWMFELLLAKLCSYVRQPSWCPVTWWGWKGSCASHLGASFWKQGALPQILSIALHLFAACFPIGRLAFCKLHAAQEAQLSLVHKPWPSLRAKTWLLGNCAAVGEYSAALCESSFDKVRMLSLIFKVVWCKPCVWRNQLFILAWRLSLLVVPAGSIISLGEQRSEPQVVDQPFHLITVCRVVQQINQTFPILGFIGDFWAIHGAEGGQELNEVSAPAPRWNRLHGI